MLRTLYSALLWLAMPVVLMRLAWRSYANPGYRRGWRERFGSLAVDLPSADELIWVHAVSVGEAQAAVPLINAIRATRPATTVFVTTTTPTGRERVQQVFGQELLLQFSPYDLPFVLRRFLRRLQPSMVVILETEIWPNLLAECAAREIPTLLLNARLSAGSAARYARVPSLIRPTLNCFTAIGAQGEGDQARFRDLGATIPISVTGSIKFDVNLPASLHEGGQALRRSWGADRSVFIAASTHDGEDELLLDAFSQIRTRHSNCLLVLVPRHPERFSKVASLARRRNFRVALRSEQPNDCSQADVYVGDTMGELPLLYAGADVAFVGGSLVPVGGHNMLEPAALGLPAVFGPYLHNFAEISHALCAAGAARTVADTIELAHSVSELLADANLRHAQGEAGRQFVASNRGALERSTAMLLQALPIPRDAT